VRDDPCKVIQSTEYKVSMPQIQLSDLMEVEQDVEWSSTALYCETIAFSLTVVYTVRKCHNLPWMIRNVNMQNNRSS